METAFKFFSENTLKYLSFHDCHCSRLYYSDETLIFEMDWMEVLADHPLNPFEKSHQSSAGKFLLLSPICKNAN